jgi:hypothetical protein
MTRTNIPMFLDTPAADRPLRADARIDLAGVPGWQAAYAEVCDAVEGEALRNVDVDDEFAHEQMHKSVADAVTNSWREGLSHDAWVSEALGRIR